MPINLAYTLKIKKEMRSKFYSERLGNPILFVVSVIYRDQCIYYGK